MLAENELVLLVGSEVLYQGECHSIKKCLSLTSFLLANKKTGVETVADFHVLLPLVETTQDQPVIERGTAWLSDIAWQEAEWRASIIRPLAAMEIVTAVVADEAAAKLNVTQRTIYTMIKRFRASGGLLTILAHNTSSGGRGRSRLPATIEKIIAATIEEIYLSKQKRRAEDVVQEVHRRCVLANLEPPVSNTVRARINKLSLSNSVRCRNGRNAARQLTAVKGSFPEVALPLGVVQMDHTPIDLIVVDEINRRPIGRPYLTAAIDIYSRCITGFCLTFEAPSAVSVGLCLVHSVIDKTSYLASLGLEGEWPIWGKPQIIYVDNATEFHSEALRRGCAQHGIQIQYRPLGQPQFGGIIERVIGTLMQHVHTLPGTTFSNIMERGEYDSDGTAILTLSELEKWLTLVIIGQYHNKVHSAIHEPPIERYKSGLIGNAKDKLEQSFKPLVLNKKAFLVDFLPIVKRSIQRHGFMIDHIIYYSNSLQPWIAERHKSHKFIIRRNPRDISRIFVLHPAHNEYIEVPYRTLNNPAVTLWEHRESLRQLKEKGISKVNEEAIFKTIDAMRKITDDAASKSRAARRKKARSSHLTNQIATPQQSSSSVLCDTQPTETKPASHSGKLFENIEEW